MVLESDHIIILSQYFLLVLNNHTLYITPSTRKKVELVKTFILNNYNILLS